MHVLSSDAGIHPDIHEDRYCAHLLVHALSHDKHRAVLQMEDGHVLTAGELHDRVSCWVQCIAQLGIGLGTRVGLLSRNRPEVVVAQIALRMLGTCWISLSPMASLGDLDYIVDDADVEVLVFDPVHFEETATELAARRSSIKHLLALGPSESGTDLMNLAALYTPTQLRAPSVSGEHVCRISYSGGTTGAPKGIVHTERSQLAMASIMMMEWEWPSEIRHLVCAPLSHAAAALLVPIIVKGGCIVVQNGFSAPAFLEAVQQLHITTTMLVPTMIYSLLDSPALGRYDLSSLQTVFYGASAISPTRLQEALQRLGPIFFQFYGQSEAPMSITLLKRSDHDVNDLGRLASCGRPVPWIDAELLDDEGKPVADGEPGEICVRGPLVSNGYLKRPEQTAEAFAGGWLHTGDIAVRDSAGWWRIVDRKKDMIISGGFNVYPREVEDVIGTHPAVAAVAVIGVPDAHWGESVKAVVVCRHGHKVAADALMALVRDRKGAIQAPKSVDFIDAIPLTPLGKPDKKALRHLFAPMQRC